MKNSGQKMRVWVGMMELTRVERRDTVRVWGFFHVRERGRS